MSKKSPKPAAPEIKKLTIKDLKNANGGTLKTSEFNGEKLTISEDSMGRIFL